MVPFHKNKLYITSRSFGMYCKEAAETLESAAKVQYNSSGRALTREELISVAEDVDGLIIGADKVTHEILKRSKRLKIIGRHGSIDRAINNTGLLLRWFRDSFGYFEKKEAEKRGVSPYQVMDGGAVKVPVR